MTLVCPQPQPQVPCLLPHDTRCVPAYPADLTGATDSGYRRRDVVPIWANMLESIDQLHAAHQFASFENVLIDMTEMPANMHQCVWNAIHVTDNSMNPGGVSAAWYRHGETLEDYVLRDTGSKFCTPIFTSYEKDREVPDSGVWYKNPAIEYPLLPLQNTVSAGVRRRACGRAARKDSDRVWYTDHRHHTGGIPQ